MAGFIEWWYDKSQEVDIVKMTPACAINQP